MAKRYIVNTIDHSWRGPVASSEQPGENEVVYDGTITEDMIWDDLLHTIRPMTAQELADRNAAIAAELADRIANDAEKTALRDAVDDAIVRLNDIINATDPTPSQIVLAIQDMALYLKYVILALRKLG